MKTTRPTTFQFYSLIVIGVVIKAEGETCYYNLPRLMTEVYISDDKKDGSFRPGKDYLGSARMALTLLCGNGFISQSIEPCPHCGSEVTVWELTEQGRKVALGED